MNFLYCGNKLEDCSVWQNISNVVLNKECSPTYDNPPFNFGIYSQALTSILASKELLSEFCTSMWWALLHSCTFGQGFPPSTSAGEVILSITFHIVGFILYAFLAGKIMAYLESLGIQWDERRIRRRDAEPWMRYHFPEDFKKRIRTRYDQYNWLETRGVNEGNIVYRLPKDLRRHNKRHLICLALTRSVSLFETLDGKLMDSLCKQLKPTLLGKEIVWIRFSSSYVIVCRV